LLASALFVNVMLSFRLVTLFTFGGVLLALTTVVLVLAQTSPLSTPSEVVGELSHT
jgi:hypothetical protein